MVLCFGFVGPLALWGQVDRTEIVSLLNHHEYSTVGSLLRSQTLEDPWLFWWRDGVTWHRKTKPQPRGSIRPLRIFGRIRSSLPRPIAWCERCRR